MYSEKENWFKTALSYRGSVIPEILPRAAFCGAVGVGVHLLHTNGIPVSLPALDSLIPNIVMGLLLVFRTNTAYDRFWEGRAQSLSTDPGGDRGAKARGFCQKSGSFAFTRSICDRHEAALTA
jgi:hypothetical protein